MHIGIRELKARATELVRNIRERKARYVITHRGRPVALLTPLEQPTSHHASAEDPHAWDELRSLGEKISKTWKSDQSAAEILADMRR